MTLKQAQDTLLNMATPIFNEGNPQYQIFQIDESHRIVKLCDKFRYETLDKNGKYVIVNSARTLKAICHSAAYSYQINN